MLRQYKLASLPALLLDAPEPDPVAKAVGEPKWDGTLPATFVYDASGKLVRSVAARLVGDARLLRFSVEAENFESIHNHSAYACIENPSEMELLRQP